jgi:hypothetical protein
MPLCVKCKNAYGSAQTVCSFCKTPISQILERVLIPGTSLYQDQHGRKWKKAAGIYKPADGSEPDVVSVWDSKDTQLPEVESITASIWRRDISLSPKVIEVLAPAVVIFGVAGLIIWMLLPAEESPAEVAERRAGVCSDTTMAFVMSQEFVRRTLKAPATAEFPFITSPGVSTRNVGECTFEVSAYVDAENSFGANIRTPYSLIMKVEPQSESWSVVP